MKFKDLTFEDEQLINSISVQILVKLLKNKQIDSFQNDSNSEFVSSSYCIFNYFFDFHY